MVRKNLSGLTAVLAAAVVLAACGKEEKGTPTPAEDGYKWTTDGGLNACDHILFTESGAEAPEGDQIGNGDQEFVFNGKQTLKKGTYVMKGWIYIADGAELTIEPGTVIKGDKQTKAAIVVERGGKLIARGSKESPIVFTSAQNKGSRRPGDWGGIILCGKARNNQAEMQIEGGPRTKHGGEDDEDNSGVLSYVRIEFAGYPFQKDKEINALTLGSVGSGTELDHIQVSYSNDDSFEWFGGKVNARYLVAYHTWDDDFDTDNGYGGKVQFALAVRNGRIADTSQSNGFESDNNAGGSDVTPYTNAMFSNVSFIGPKSDPAFVNTTDYITGGDFNPGNGSALGRFQAAMHIRRASRLNCINSIAAGFPIGIMLDGEKGDTQEAAGRGLLKLCNIWMADMDIIGSDMNKLYEDVLVTDYASKTMDSGKNSFSHDFFLAQKGNRYFDDASSLSLEDWDNVGSPFLPSASSPVMSAAAWEDADGWFEKVPYIGAVSASDNWLEGWTSFDPEYESY